MMVSVVATAALATWSCSSNDVAPESIGSDCLVGGVVVSPASATLHPGDSLQVSVATQECPGVKSSTPGDYFWKATDSTVAVVDSISGMIHARHSGTTTIVAANSLEPVVTGAMALTVSP